MSIAQFFFVSTYFVTGITILGIQQTGPALTCDHFLPKVSRETVEKFCWKAATTNIDQNYKQFYNCTRDNDLDMKIQLFHVNLSLLSFSLGFSTIMHKT